MNKIKLNKKGIFIFVVFILLVVGVVGVYYWYNEIYLKLKFLSLDADDADPIASNVQRGGDHAR